jgi:guanylate kinase
MHNPGATKNMKDLYIQPNYPRLFVISGPSGVGKDTVARMMLESRDSFYFVVTATTRPPREGEIDGHDYFFMNHDDFAQMIEDDELLEYAVVYNDYKGVPKQQIRDALASGQDVIMRVDVQGAATIRKLIPNAILIFLTAESEDALIKRLKERKSETAEGLKLRIATARREMMRLEEFDYCIVNAEGRVMETVQMIMSIIDAEHSRVDQQPITL